MTALTKSVVTLGGREFTIIDFSRRPLAMDLHLRRVFHDIGADKFRPLQGEAVKNYLARVYELVVDSGRALDLIAGRLLPVGASPESWNAETAAEIAAHIGRCNTPEDRDRFLELGVRTVGDVFFMAGLEYLNIDPKRSIDRG